MLTIVVSWRNRVQLCESLPSLLATCDQIGGDLTIVNYDGDESMLGEQLAGVERGRLSIVRITGERYFNKARAQNIGAAHARHPILFFCDCDIVVNPDEISELAAHLYRDARCFATLAGVRESVTNARKAGNLVRFGYELNLRLANGRTLRIVDNEEDAETGTRQAPGLLLVRRTDFLSVNGYNGRLHGWGWEDQDMIARLALGAGLDRLQRGVVTHISHGEEERMAHYPAMSSRWESRDRMFRQALAFYDAGDLSGTFNRDRSQLRHELVQASGR